MIVRVSRCVELDELDELVIWNLLIYPTSLTSLINLANF